MLSEKSTTGFNWEKSGMGMNALALKNTAIELRGLLERYQLTEPDARHLLLSLQQLITAAEQGHITTPVEARDIPGHRMMDESNLRQYRDLSAAYSNFHIELIDGREWESFKRLEHSMKKNTPIN